MSNEHEPDLTIAEAITRATDIIASPGMTFGETSARRIITGLLAGLHYSPCYFKALRKGEEVFVLRQQDRAAPDAITEWAELANEHGCEGEKVNSAYQKAKRWREQDLAVTKWPD